MRGPMMWKDYKDMDSEQFKEHQYMMGRYMGMQQNMMNQIMQHQYWMQEHK